MMIMINYTYSQSHLVNSLTVTKKVLMLTKYMTTLNPPCISKKKNPSKSTRIKSLLVIHAIKSHHKISDRYKKLNSK